ncbi:MAG: hypothetical protein K2X12_21570 [Burkholderiaceae bacterium]|jgi:hypothetical protein|nr:hypothetical protein [Burkholderiaceae bacterium]
MAEPGRKVNKGRHDPALTLVSTPQLPAIVATSNPGQSDSDPLLFWTEHPTKPLPIDLRRFATGVREEDLKGNAKSQWTGDFTGRPELIADLLPAIKEEWRLLHSESHRNNRLQTLRTWWRVLDEAERGDQTSQAMGSSRVKAVEDLHELHYVISKRNKVSTTHHGNFLRLVNIRLKQKSLPGLYWPSPDYVQKSSEVPAHWEIETIRHRLKHGWFATLSRWERADEQAPDLLSWKTLPADRWKEQVHAIYRAVVAQTGDPVPSLRDVAQALGSQSKMGWMSPIGVPQLGLYPNGDDVRNAFNLCLLYSGWNIQTLLDVNVAGRFVEPHPTNPDYHLVYGFKNRGQSEHFCMGRKKRTDSPGTILTRLVERTAPLRKKLRDEHTQVLTELQADAGSEALTLRRIELEQCLKSPWLYFDVHQGIRRLSMGSFNTTSGGPYLRLLIREINQKQPADRQVRESITPGDFRDAYIAFAYEFSNYSVLTAQVAANHKNAGTTQTYLRHKAWRAHSARKVRELSTAVWHEIEIHRKVEPAVLRAKLEHGGVSDDERRRLAIHKKNRTRVGVGCKDFTHPPPSLAPEHDDGSGCRVQRCTLCPTHAIVFDDSYEHLTRRQAELEDTRDKIPVPVWNESSFPQELENTEAVLTRFDAQLVRERLSHWRDQIKLGKHFPIVFEGAYT